jgi:phage shock protein A
MADSSLLPSTVSTTGMNSFWSRKEGKTGMVVGIALLAALGYGLYQILPFLITLTKNLLTLALLGICLFVLVYLIMDSQVRTLVWYLYKSLMRAITGIFIQIDPVGIIESYVDHLRKQLQSLGGRIQELSGAKRKLQDGIDRAKAELDEQLNLAKAGQKKGLGVAEITVYTNQAGRLKTRIEKYQSLYAKLETLYRILEKMEKAAKVVIMDKTNQVEDIKTQRQEMKTGFNAFKSAMSILAGDPDKKVLFDRAMESIQNDISMKSGAMERFIEESGEVMQSIDLQNGAFEEKGLKLLEKWETEGLPLLLTDGSENLPAADQMRPVDASFVEVSKQSSKSGDNTYKDMLNK